MLVEVHDEAELERALDTEARIIGVNNRNLKSFVVDLETTARLSEEIPGGLIFISESGLKTANDARQVYEAGANGILVGESLMLADGARRSHRGLPRLRAERIVARPSKPCPPSANEFTNFIPAHQEV